MQNLILNKEFQDLIPPLTESEYIELRASVVREGCRNPLIVWQDTLLDGHHRYRICREHNIPFKTTSMEFESKEEAKLWILNNQLARRNLNLYQRAELALKYKEIYAVRGKQRQGTRTDLLPNSVKSDQVNAQKEMAKKAGVSHDTIYKVEKIKEIANKEVEMKLAKGEMSINNVYTVLKRKQKAAEDKKRIEYAKAHPEEVPEKGTVTRWKTPAGFIVKETIEGEMGGFPIKRYEQNNPRYEELRKNEMSWRNERSLQGVMRYMERLGKELTKMRKNPGTWVRADYKLDIAIGRICFDKEFLKLAQKAKKEIEAATERIENTAPPDFEHIDSESQEAKNGRFSSLGWSVWGAEA